MDGLVFCRRAYQLLDRVQKAQNGMSRIRRLTSKTEKRLTEEFIPIAAYIQRTYSAGLRVRIQWLAGNQSFDGKLRLTGSYVKAGRYPQTLYLEVTSAVEKNAHLARELLDTKGGSFGAMGIRRDQFTRDIISEPHVWENGEFVRHVRATIMAAFIRKCHICYPADTILLITCTFSRPPLPNE